MNREELYQLLDIDDPAEFQYFENLADFLECEEELDYDDVAELFHQVDKDVLAQLVGDYFEEITDFVPDNETELFSIFENVRRALVGMCRNREDETVEAKLVDELERFRRWYSMENNAFYTELATMAEENVSLRDALVASRMENIGGTKYQYDFSECMNYPLDDYMVSLGDMVAMGEEEDASNSMIEENLNMES